MLQRGCLIAVLALAILIMIPMVASHYVPGWAVLLVIAAEIVGVRYLIPWIIKRSVKRFAESMITAKSRVLQGARVHIHRVERTAPPVEATDRRLLAHEQPIDSSEGNATLIGAGPAEEQYVLVEFTLTPRTDREPTMMQFYDPSELLLIPFDDNAPSLEDSDDSRSAHVHSVGGIDESGVEHEIDKLNGPATLRAIFTVPPTLNGRVKFRYYFESFGDFLLPL